MHACDGAPDYEGGEFLMARCTCGWSQDGFPDEETAIDSLMDHAYGVGRVDGQGDGR